MERIRVATLARLAAPGEGESMRENENRSDREKARERERERERDWLEAPLPAGVVTGPAQTPGPKQTMLWATQLPPARVNVTSGNGKTQSVRCLETPDYAKLLSKCQRKRLTTDATAVMTFHHLC